MSLYCHRSLGTTQNVQIYKKLPGSLKKRAQNWQKEMFSCQTKSTDDGAFCYKFIGNEVTTHNVKAHISNRHLGVAKLRSILKDIMESGTTLRNHVPTAAQQYRRLDFETVRRAICYWHDKHSSSWADVWISSCRQRTTMHWFIPECLSSQQAQTLDTTGWSTTP